MRMWPTKVILTIPANLIQNPSHHDPLSLSQAEAGNSQLSIAAREWLGSSTDALQDLARGQALALDQVVEERHEVAAEVAHVAGSDEAEDGLQSQSQPMLKTDQEDDSLPWSR